MEKTARGNRNWFLWNLANFISIGRLIGMAYVLFAVDWDYRLKLVVCASLEATDWLDGLTARTIGNKDGIGKIIDPVVDKLDKGMILFFLFIHQLLDSRIIGAVLLGEAFVAVIAGYSIWLVIKRQRFVYEDKNGRGDWGLSKVRNIVRDAQGEVLRQWAVNIPGKMAMIFYFAMAVLVFLNLEFAPSQVFEFGYKLAFLGGLIARGFSVYLYGARLYRWYNIYSAPPGG